MLAVAGWFSYNNPNRQGLFEALILSAGLVLVWLGLALSPNMVANLALILPWLSE